MTFLDRPTHPVGAVAPPTPRPPVAARPRHLSVTEIETWMRDPYQIYARHILGLRALDPIEADPGEGEALVGREGLGAGDNGCGLVELDDVLQADYGDGEAGDR